jgi:hypothetical protein
MELSSRHGVLGSGPGSICGVRIVVSGTTGAIAYGLYAAPRRGAWVQSIHGVAADCAADGKVERQGRNFSMEGRESTVCPPGIALTCSANERPTIRSQRFQ